MIVRSARARRRTDGTMLALACTLLVHSGAVLALLGGPGMVHRDNTPVYNVQLVAAPAPEPHAKPAPAVVSRPAEQAVPIARKPPPRRTSVAPTPPPPTARPERREAAPRTTAAEAPAPGVTPSTGTDVATVNTGGIAFEFPEYINNIVAQIYRRWQRPEGNAALQAEVMFLVHRDGTISNLQFVKRSGSFVFDLEAQGAIEAAGNAKAFGPLPDGYQADVLPVSFFFKPGTIQ